MFKDGVRHFDMSELGTHTTHLKTQDQPHVINRLAEIMEYIFKHL